MNDKDIVNELRTLVNTIAAGYNVKGCIIVLHDEENKVRFSTEDLDNSKVLYCPRCTML